MEYNHYKGGKKIIKEPSFPDEVPARGRPPVEESDLDEEDDMEFNKWKYGLKNKRLYHLEQTILKLQNDLAETRRYNLRMRKKILLLLNI